MWLGYGLDVFSDVTGKSLAEVKGKRFPASLMSTSVSIK